MNYSSIATERSELYPAIGIGVPGLVFHLR